ncbi:protein of unknown function [Cupriavidus taiwanensis]|uniref:Uncharacterized protein n=1 Tax=Cupriavidus taiwanensis TaxID=164546 RepID=A0A375GJW9_9BURK|nr:protein of unknown function [Cupriavidus taiwanensis]SOZ42554.1 protein of unknown function [Cupriavidus taiwanensis]SPC20230.1 hypothetical protein CT19431_MP80080 [Cupriavidus taiwanensis]SPC21567.1 protein of unknown function [Cupriavidus taiwanensis]
MLRNRHAKHDGAVTPRCAGAMRAMRHAPAGALLQRLARFTQHPARCGGPCHGSDGGYGAC